MINDETPLCPRQAQAPWAGLSRAETEVLLGSSLKLFLPEGAQVGLPIARARGHRTHCSRSRCGVPHGILAGFQSKSSV